LPKRTPFDFMRAEHFCAYHPPKLKLGGVENDLFTEYFLTFCRKDLLVRFKVLAAFAASFLTVGPVALISGSPAAAQGETKVRLAHFSPDAPAVDIYIDGKKKLTNVPFQAVSDYTSLSAGRHVFELRASGTAETSTAALTVSQDFIAGKNYTVAAFENERAWINGV
jgi:Domain of unknown function (DUF4397)